MCCTRIVAEQVEHQLVLAIATWAHAWNLSMGRAYKAWFAIQVATYIPDSGLRSQRGHWATMLRDAGSVRRLG